MLQLISKFVPINNIFDDSFLRDLVFYASKFHGAVFPELRQRYDIPIYDGIVQHILPQFANHSERALLIAGHSLGGGVAHITAARLHSDGL